MIVFVSGSEADSAFKRDGASGQGAAGHGTSAELLAAVPALPEAHRQQAAREPPEAEALQEPYHPGLQDARRGHREHGAGPAAAAGYGAGAVHRGEGAVQPQQRGGQGHRPGAQQPARRPRGHRQAAPARGTR